MKRSYIGLALGALVAMGAVFSLPSCGHHQKLVSLTVSPATALYPTPEAGQVVFSAIGTYIQPPATKDITNQVKWSTDVPELLSVNNSGRAWCGGAEWVRRLRGRGHHSDRSRRNGRGVEYCPWLRDRDREQSDPSKLPGFRH